MLLTELDSPFDYAQGKLGRLICEDSEGNGDCVEAGLCGDGFCGGRASPPVQADCVGTSARVVTRTKIGFIGSSPRNFRDDGSSLQGMPVTEVRR